MTPEQTFNAAYFERQHPAYLKWLTVAALLAVLVLGALHPTHASDADPAPQHSTAASQH